MDLNAQSIPVLPSTFRCGFCSLRSCARAVSSKSVAAWGYTAAVLAEAGGEDSRVDTIENVESHADLAEVALAQRGLAGRVRVLRGEAKTVLSNLGEPYDLVFIDSDWDEYMALLPDLTRLTRRGGVLVTANISPERIDWNEGVGEYLTRLVADSRFHTFVIPGFWRAISYRLTES